MATGSVEAEVFPANEHQGWVCSACGSTWIRFEHIDAKDCDEDCEDPCLIRCCNEEDCLGGEAVLAELYLG